MTDNNDFNNTKTEAERILITVRQQDHSDLQDEIAGRETGRQKRFLVGEDASHRDENRRRAERTYRHMLDMLLATDPEYRRIYFELGERLSAAEAEADAVIGTLQAEIEGVDQALGDMKDRAARLPDGTRVFKAADGRVVDEHGREVPVDTAEGIIWPPDAPSAEEYFALKEKRDELAALLQRWQDHRNDTLGGIRDRYDDPDNPMTKEEMEQAIQDIEAMRPPETDHAADALPLESSAPATGTAFPSISG